jgi:hypothetical protein
VPLPLQQLQCFAIVGLLYSVNPTHNTHDTPCGPRSAWYNITRQILGFCDGMGSCQGSPNTASISIRVRDHEVLPRTVLMRIHVPVKYELSRVTMSFSRVGALQLACSPNHRGSGIRLYSDPSDFVHPLTRRQSHASVQLISTITSFRSTNLYARGSPRTPTLLLYVSIRRLRCIRKTLAGASHQS